MRNITNAPTGGVQDSPLDRTGRVPTGKLRPCLRRAVGQPQRVQRGQAATEVGPALTQRRRGRRATRRRRPFSFSAFLSESLRLCVNPSQPASKSGDSCTKNARRGTWARDGLLPQGGRGRWSNRLFLFGLSELQSSRFFSSCEGFCEWTATRSVWRVRPTCWRCHQAWGGSKSGSKLHALQTLRAIRLRQRLAAFSVVKTTLFRITPSHRPRRFGSQARGGTAAGARKRSTCHRARTRTLQGAEPTDRKSVE